MEKSGAHKRIFSGKGETPPPNYSPVQADAQINAASGISINNQGFQNLKAIGEPTTVVSEGSVYYNWKIIALLLALLVLAIAGLIISAIVLWNNNNQTKPYDNTLMIPINDTLVDYIQIGGGTTGVPLAWKLSQDPANSVLVLEAGDDQRNNLDANDMGDGLRMGVLYLTDPYRYYYMYDTVFQLDTKYLTTIAGRALGGSTQINDKYQVKGDPEFWDEQDLVMSGGSGVVNGDNMYRVFKEIEYLRPSPVYVPDSSRTLTENPWQIMVSPTSLNLNDDCHIIMSTLAGALGIPYGLTVGYNDPTSVLGAFPSNDLLYDFSKTNTISGPLIGWSPAKAFLNSSVVDPITLTNLVTRRLVVLTRATVKRLIFHPYDPTMLIGAQYIDKDGVIRRAFARKATILSMWNNDVALLQQSGIGPASVLADAGITPRVINENVGCNWKIHPIVPQVCLFPNVTGINTEDPVIQSGFASAFVEDPISGGAGKRGFHLISVGFPGVMAFFQFHLRAQSLGTISVYTDDPEQPPKFQPNIYSHPDDVLSWKTFMRTFIPSVQAYDPNIMCISIDNTTLFAEDGTFEQWLIDNTDPGSPTHGYGACRMGASISDSVVDKTFSIHGIKKGKICDSHVLSLPTPGNPSYPLAAMGIICAETILGNQVPAPELKSTAKHAPKYPRRKYNANTVPLSAAHKSRGHVTHRDMSQSQYEASIAAIENISNSRLSADKKQILINGIMNTHMWRVADMQYGPYVPPNASKKRKVMTGKRSYMLI